MNNLKCNTVGVDTSIKGYQEHLYDGIVDNWSLSDFEGYGRVYKNKRDSKVFPEYYVSDREYKEVLLDDSLDGIMFFSPYDFTSVNGYLSVQKCDIMFSFNLSSIGSGDTRQDEELRTDIISILNGYDNRVSKEITTGLNNVYSEYSGVSEYFKDMQDFHHFKITLELRYNNQNCKN